MNANGKSVSNIYFTSWQYVRIGGYSPDTSSGGSGVAWIGATVGSYVRPAMPR